MLDFCPDCVMGYSFAFFTLSGATFYKIFLVRSQFCPPIFSLVQAAKHNAQYFQNRLVFGLKDLQDQIIFDFGDAHFFKILQQISFKMGKLKNKRFLKRKFYSLSPIFASKFMRHFSGILIFCFSLFTVLPMNGLLACGDHAATEKPGASEKMCCKEKSVEEPAHCEEETHTCEQKHPGQKCPDQGGCCGSGCTCPCGAIPGGHTVVVLAEIPFSFSATSDATLRQAFYFAQHMPEEVYLPIWQPPQLSA